MKQILPLLFLWFFLFTTPGIVRASITFTIENPVREGDYFILDASISGISSSSAYVQGVFTHTSSPNYFGFTWGQKEDWVSYQSNTTKEYISQYFPLILRDTLQKIWVKPNFEDSAFKGSGDYFLKLRRYTGSGDSSAGESNVLTVYLLAPTPVPIETPSSTPTPTTTPEPTLTLNPTKTPSPTPTKTPTPVPLKTNTPTPSLQSTPRPTSIPSSAGISSDSGAVLGDATSSSILVLDNAFITPTSSSSSNNRDLSSNNVVLKYTFLFAATITLISGSLLYFRHQND